MYKYMSLTTPGSSHGCTAREPLCCSWWNRVSYYYFDNAILVLQTVSLIIEKDKSNPPFQLLVLTFGLEDCV